MMTSAGGGKRLSTASRAAKSCNKYVQRRTDAEKRLLVKQAEALHAQRERDEAHALVQVTKRLDAHCCFY
jgi:hypothetical protein